MTTTYSAFTPKYSLRYDLQLPTNNTFRVMNYLHTLFCNRPEEGFYLISRNMHVCNAKSNKLDHLKLLFISAVRLRLKCDGTRAENIFRLSAKRTSPFKPAGSSDQSTTGSRGVRISGSNHGYTMFRVSLKGTCYPLHSPLSPSFPLPCVAVCHHNSTGAYYNMQTN